MVYTDQIVSWTNAQKMAYHQNAAITELVIDSRKINNAASSLFIALNTEKRDGHQFIKDAYAKGVRNFLVQNATEIYPGANFLVVSNTLTALQQFVAAYRKQFQIPVIGITGSNGKTVVKEWLSQLLGEQFSIVKNPKSYNSQIGVPLSVWLMEPEHKLGIFEAGISQPGEMDKLEKIIQPTIGIFTNIGVAHSEGFLNLRQKINEKLVLFRHAQQLIYCTDHLELNDCILQYRNQLRGSDREHSQNIFTWSQKHHADLRILSLEKQDHNTKIKAAYKEQEISITIPFTDPASMENAIHCWCALILLDIPQERIEAQMKKLQPVAMRLELKHGINDCTIINDTYNSDLTSLHIALDYLEQQTQHEKKTVILSDMLQAGKSDPELYEDVAEAISRKKIDRFIGVGPAIGKQKAVFRKHRNLRSSFFKSTEELLMNFHLIGFENEAILLKGARVFEFEKIGQLLEQKIHQTVLSINLSSLSHNLNVYQSLLKKGVKTMAMVKAFSYGSGSYEIAHTLQFAGVDYLSVAYTDEGIELRKAGITMPIMVMSPDADSFDRMIAWKLEPEIFNLSSLDAFLDIASTFGVQQYPIHIKLDTGMHRLGFVAEELSALLSELDRNDRVKVASIFSHLAASEDSSLDYFTEEQAQRFKMMSDELIRGLEYQPLRHLCNSAAIARHPSLHFDMVRLGIGLYGVDSGGNIQHKLKHIGSLKTTIAQIKNIPQGETIGYGRKGKADIPMRIATVCIGYADGYPRGLGNGKAYMLVRGKQAPVVGVVCMDMCMLDISHIPDAQEGDDVIVFNEELPVTDLAAWAGTIPYEIMTGISQRVKRVYVNEE